MKFIILAAAFLLFIIAGCSKNLETKVASQTIDLNQVVSSGHRDGSKPHDFAVLTTDGKSFVLGNAIREKKPVVIYFMATWCQYCAQDYKALSGVFKDYEGNVTIISIDLDLGEDLKKLREYKKKYPALEKAMFAEGQSKILSEYGVTKTTTKFAVGRNGTIMYSTIGAFSESQWKTLLDAMANSRE